MKHHWIARRQIYPQAVGSQHHTWGFHCLLTSACIICIILPQENKRSFLIITFDVKKNCSHALFDIF